MKTVAINGLGRIGRAFLKLYLTDEKVRQQIDIVAINDLGDLENMIYLLQYDSVYKDKIFKKIYFKIVNPTDKDIAKEYSEKNLEKYICLELYSGEKREIRFLSVAESVEFIKNKIWKNLNIDIVVECTGIFVSAEKSHFHLESGAKRVVISAPLHENKNSMYHSETVLLGINEEKFKESTITSNASCTTNAASPILQILDEALGIEKAILNTVHSYTASQNLVDGVKKDWREGRAGAQNIIPSTTGAALAVTKAITSLENKFDGISIRVPTLVGSIVDLTFITKRNTSVEEINRILENASQEQKWQNIFTITREPLVSTDIQGLLYASIADLNLTKVVDGNLVKVLAWYDNETGYAHTLLQHVIKVGNCLPD